MYEFARGPLVWIALLTFVFGSLYRVIWIIRESKKDKVVHPYMSWRFGLRSIAHWITPFGSRNMRLRPAFTVMSFLFHICLLLTPVFVLGHVLLWEESWGIRWWTLPERLSNIMSIIVLLSVIVFALRRFADPTVRMVTSSSDYLLLLVVGAPFLTGIMAYYQIFDYRTIITIHMFTGALWLIIIPFTRIIHMLFFPFTRAYMGCEFGLVRHARDW